ncbi:MAG: MFS transporter [Gammaproteobacteria bacterium]|nr:MFS transporter [Gammaproteobacteria bacterium]MDH5303722.1 MFS transporter [Gammaproteobacteria bacterium]MDH5322696.1 MFS transporter [Gammaproteobacteria bacterium]
MPKVVYANDPQTQKSLQHSIKDAGAYAVMIGIGETYLSAFALFLKASTPQMGLLASLPTLLASLVQLFSAWLGRWTGQRKLIILSGVMIQALAWLPLMILPILFPQYAVPLMIACVVLYHCGAHLAAPQWSSLMGDIVPDRRRGRFFARRTGIISIVTFVALMMGGLILQVSTEREATRQGFIILFSIAMLARFTTFYQLSKMHDPSGHVAAMEVPVGQAWWQRLRQSNFVRFSVFFALVQFSVAIASPFFTVYMLRDLEFSYVMFMCNSGMAVLAQFLTLNRWGRISDVFGNRRILAATGILLPLMPLLWVFSSNFWYLLLVQAISGLAWAGFTLSASNFLYDLIARDKRATYLAIHNVLASFGIFAGAITGGYLGSVLPTEVSILGHTYSWLSPLLGVFLISALVRATIVMLLVPKIREVRNVRPISFRDLIFRVTRVNALAGIIFDVIGTKNKQQ